ncbi:hypothetical protein K431DRAFT_283248 [Polychaeton citri CBS 116435]|uniref:Uncharacterized protein n=1 Tax=Polychaeton citri CBS 116435 TaxID=1314669 RepID=A0A9P4QDU6_9PEZI|nr:hypothetical protein K431DRAFT_283248 [Polychaeton citri CBS 116435]
MLPSTTIHGVAGGAVAVQAAIRAAPAHISNQHNADSLRKRQEVTATLTLTTPSRFIGWVDGNTDTAYACPSGSVPASSPTPVPYWDCIPFIAFGDPQTTSNWATACTDWFYSTPSAIDYTLYCGMTASGCVGEFLTDASSNVYTHYKCSDSATEVNLYENVILPSDTSSPAETSNLETSSPETTSPETSNPPTSAPQTSTSVFTTPATTSSTTASPPYIPSTAAVGAWTGNGSDTIGYYSGNPDSLATCTDGANAGFYTDPANFWACLPTSAFYLAPDIWATSCVSGVSPSVTWSSFTLYCGGTAPSCVESLVTDISSTVYTRVDCLATATESVIDVFESPTVDSTSSTPTLSEPSRSLTVTGSTASSTTDNAVSTVSITVSTSVPTSSPSAGSNWRSLNLLWLAASTLTSIIGAIG